MRNLIKKRRQEKIFFHRKLFLVAMLFLLLSISACSKKKAVEKKLEDIRTGTQGIVMNFLPNAPPNKIHVDIDSNTFDVILEARNKGAYPQPEDVGSIQNNFGYVFLSGYDPKIIEFKTSAGSYINYLKPTTLEGKSTINPNGGLDILTFNGIVNVNNLKVEKYEPTLLATSCYYYETTAGPSVCIDPNPYSVTTEKKVCQVQSVSLSNQGAPIAVTRIDEEALAGRTQFKITIKNVGGGDVIKSLDKCATSKITREDIDKLSVYWVSISDKALECGPYAEGPYGESLVGGRTTSTSGGVVRLISGEGFIICNFQKENYKESITAFTTPIFIKLGYGYRTSIEKKIQIKKEISSSGTMPTQTAESYEGYNPYV